MDGELPHSLALPAHASNGQGHSTASTQHEIVARIHCPTEETTTYRPYSIFNTWHDMPALTQIEMSWHWSAHSMLRDCVSGLIGAI